MAEVISNIYHVASESKGIHALVRLIVGFLCVCGLQGLFRVAPSASKLKKLKASLDCGVVDVQEYSSDPHAIAGAVNNNQLSAPEVSSY